MRTSSWLLLLAGLMACSGDKDTTDTDTDAADTDTDVDTDTDTDTDVDTDTDTDVDSDTDTDTGDTGTPTTATGDTGTTTTAGVDWAFVIEGSSQNCSVGWEIAETLASYTCTNCPYTLEWTYDASFSASLALSDSTGCGAGYADSQVVYISQNLTYQTNSLNRYASVWGWTNNYGGTNQAALLGYWTQVGMLDAGDLYAFPGTWDQVSGDFEFVDPYYGLFRGYGNHL